ncbi:unnamed protein product [Candidula unifasciata]|uniref:Carboxylesterase type B domain-containing protein n=1 Tax=Candidula unifasciata TaxID=100452 RepID=A0A8S4A2C3_9EUPU|nr:unnamed protein product [Candidula unifasciata]
MSNFAYNHLQDELGSLAVSQTAHVPQTPVNLSTNPQFDSIQLHSSEDNGDDVPGLSISNNSENVRYTALRPTSVRELVEIDVDRDTEGTDSSILVRLPSSKKPTAVPKVYIVICGLLIAGVVLVAFTLVYVFIILPNSNEKHFLDDEKESAAAVTPDTDAILVRSSCGVFQGLKEEDALVFRGIPYASPPTGQLRWKPPVAIDAQSSATCKHVFNATDYGSKCLQPKFDNVSVFEGSENCLFLNIWTPSLSPSSPLPVMVWFHSGDLIYGSGNMAGMSPNPQVAGATNAVYISFNYRLGVLGFLAVDELRQESDGAAGNYGFMDQQMLLMWVKENIRQFGGDEKKVTIFGHGSGATSVLAMLMSPDNSGLFNKAWLTSPVAIINKTVDEACRDNRVFMEKSGCDSVQCLRQLPAETVARLSPWPVQNQWTLDQLFATVKNGQLRNDLPIFDGHVLPRLPLLTRRDKLAVPVVFGSTYLDMSGLDLQPGIFNITWDVYSELLDQHLGVLGSEASSLVKSFYSKKSHKELLQSTQFLSPASVQFLHLLGDVKNVCPTKVLANAVLTTYLNSSAVFMYLADFVPSNHIQASSPERIVFFGWDIVAFFGTFQDLGFKIGQGELNFQNILREEIMSFVKSGRPDASRWKTADVNVGVIGSDVTVTPVAFDDFVQCDLWKQYGFFNYTWQRHF